MQAVEALQRLIEAADHRASQIRSASEDAEVHALAEDLSLAAAVGQAMLNTAIAVARYRAFVEIDEEQPKRTKFQQKMAVTDEFTICAVNMRQLKAGLIGISHVPTKVKVTVFEQRANGADMISGYQGQTKGNLNWNRFLEGLSALEAIPTVQ